ncbi:MAG: N-acetyltransferase [Aliishimia sp.]
MKFQIRPEEREDQQAIYTVTEAAFEGKPYADGTEAPIIDELRKDGDLTISLVASVAGKIVGHAAFSPALIGNASSNWYGLGPVSVAPDLQKQGIGQALIKEGLAMLLKQSAAGCLLIGDPNYYSRFGFRGDCGLSYEDLTPSLVQALAFGSSLPSGEVRFAPAFYKFGA